MVSTSTATAVSVVIPIAVAVPSMVMFKPASISLPITFEEQLSVITCCHPAGTRVRRPSPVSVMPPVMVFYRIPITLNPHVFRIWRRYWNNAHHARWRGWANVDSDRNLSLSPDDRSADQQECGNKCRPYQTFHAVNLSTAIGNFRSNPVHGQPVAGQPRPPHSAVIAVSNVKGQDRKV